jgi:ubiquinone/menaquinone biosynthesis C-methylase UbiE
VLPAFSEVHDLSGPSTTPPSASDGAASAPDPWQEYDHEAEAARNPQARAHLNPVFPRGARVINVGCGGGWEGESVGTSRYVGVDINDKAVAYRRARNYQIEFFLADGEQLPLADGEFTFYMARVSLMYMDLRKGLAEAYRVLADGGQLWVTCHDFAEAWEHLRRSVLALRVKDVIYRSYVIANGLLYHFTGRLVRFPFGRRRMESFQTRAGIRRGLLRAGFRDVQFPQTAHGHFLVTARKGPSSGE